MGAVKPVFDRKYVTLLDYEPDVERMRLAAAYLLGEQDFASFCGNPRMKKSTVRMVDHIGIEQRRDRVIFTFHGTGFLQNMVRIMVGTLLEVGRGFWEPEKVGEILLARDRKQAGPTAPPEGLCLMKVDFCHILWMSSSRSDSDMVRTCSSSAGVGSSAPSRSRTEAGLGVSSAGAGAFTLSAGATARSCAGASSRGTRRGTRAVWRSSSWGGWGCLGVSGSSS